VNIRIFNSQTIFRPNRPAIRRLVQTVLNAEHSTHSEVAIYLVSKAKISKLHEEFFSDPTPTDCISFPIDDEHLGEIFVCPQLAFAYAKKKELGPKEETALYIVHGLLHCLGYDDLTPSDRRTMRKKEKSCMALLKAQHISV